MAQGLIQGAGAGKVPEKYNIGGTVSLLYALYLRHVGRLVQRKERWINGRLVRQ